MKKSISMLLAASMVSTMLAGCGAAASSTPSAVSSSGEAAPSAAAAESVTLKLATWDNTSNNVVTDAVAAFEAANPNIKVEIIDIPSADYTTKLSVMLNGGSDVDAFYIKDGDTAKSLVEKGQLADMSSYIAADGVNLADYNGLAENFSFDGKQYALPARTDFYVMYYNKDLFDAANVAYPTNDWTWTDFEETAKKLTSGEGANKIYGAAFHTWQACIQNWGVQDGKHQKVKDGESNVNWGIATLPHAEGVEAGYTVGSMTPLAINAASDKQDAAWELVKFITGEEGAASYAKNGAIPGRSNAEAIAEIAEMEGMPADAAEALTVKNISLDRPITDKVGEVNQMLGEEHSLIMLGELSVDEGLAEMAERAAEIVG